MTQVLDPAIRRFTEGLDTLEDRLAPVPSKALALTRASTRRVNDVTAAAATRIGDGWETVARTAVAASKTVVGQGRSAIDRSVAAVTKGRNETIGQFDAQLRRTVGTVRSETASLLDDATSAVAPETIDPASLDALTKEELYERAKDLDIDGRSAMTKTELVAALRSA